MLDMSSYTDHVNIMIYESKVLHNTEVSRFSTAHGSLKTNHFDIKNSYTMP